MVKFLEDELKTSETKHCDTCNCPNRDLTVLAILPKSYAVGTQTINHVDVNNALCLRCNSNLNSPSRTDSPFIMTKVVKSSDSVISETKSSVSDSTQNDKLFTPAKKESNDTIMVNPILGHHRLCDRANNKTIATGQLISVGGITSPAKVQHEGSILDIKSSTCKTAMITKITDAPKIVEINLNNTIKNEHETDLLLMHHEEEEDEPLNDEDEEGINESTSLLGLGATATTPIASKTNSIANKLLLKSPEFMGGAKPKTPEVVNKVETIGIPNNSSATSTTTNTNNTIPMNGDVDKKSESLRGPGNGSTNSLWSRTSSRDGSKIFENFNRNLIKTIKAENPKMKGPRICALRIQNGSNNIVLDNAAAADGGEQITSTPIVYTRRFRLVDEELDDEKEVTLAIEKTTTHSSQTETLTKTDATSNVKLVVNQTNSSNNNNIAENEVLRNQSTSIIKHRTSQCSISSDMDLRRQQLSRVAEWVQNNSKLNDMSKTHSTSVSDIDIDILSFDGSTAVGAAAATTTTTTSNVNRSRSTLPTTNTQQQHKNSTTNALEQCNNNATSSGNSLNDFAQTNISNSNNNNNNVINTINTNSNSNNNNKNPSTNNTNPTSATTSNSINLYKYFELYAAHQEVEDDDDDDEEEEEIDDDLLENECNESYDEYDEDNSDEKNLDDENQIDLAQMEYNVKQFLLKQSEWSIHNKIASGSGNNHHQNTNEMTGKTIPQRTETNL